MARNILNEGCKTNVYLNRDPIQATLPVQAIQPTTSDPITISLIGLNGIGASNAEKVIKVNSSGTALEYATDLNTSNWTVSGSDIYPNTATKVLVNTTSNPNGYGLLVLDKEIAVQTSAGSGASQGVRIINDTYSVLNYVDNSGDMFWTGATNNFNFSKQVIINTTGAELSNGTNTYTLPSSNGTLSLTTDIIAEIYGGTNQTSYTTGDLLYSSATNTLAKLAIGSAGQVLKVSSGGIVEWANESSSDTTTAQNFGTAVTGGNTIKLGNSAGTSQTTNLELYTSATLKIFNTSNVEVARFTPVSNTCDLKLNGGVITFATMGTSTTWNGSAIAYNYGGTGLTSLTADKILQVNATATGYNLVDMPSTTTQYWSLSSNVLSPVNSSYAIRSESGIRYGTAGEFVDIGYNTSTNVFSIDHSTGSNIFDYDEDNGYINWGTKAGARMDFNSYILHGADTAYPSGVSMPFGTIGSIYVSSAFMTSITTDEVLVSEYQGSPATTSSTIRCNSSGEIYFTNNKLKIGELIGNSNASNILSDDVTSFQMSSGNDSFILALRPLGRSIYPYFGSPSTSVPYHIHINTISGNPYEIHNTDNTQAGFQHYLNGEEVSMCSDRASYYRSGSYVYFYNPLGTNGDHTFSGSYYAYHDNGSAIYFNLPSGGTTSGYYISFATANSQIARIDMGGSGKITGSWTGSWSGTSDRRLKENIVPIENAVDTLMKINVYQFDKYDIDNYDVNHHEEGEDTLKPFKERLSENTRFVYGFIAQEICENTPQLGKMCVETNDWGDEEPAYIIDDRPMLACAIKTIQEQQEEINTLKNELNDLKNIINKLVKAPSFKNFKDNLNVT